MRPTVVCTGARILHILWSAVSCYICVFDCTHRRLCCQLSIAPYFFLRTLYAAAAAAAADADVSGAIGVAAVAASMCHAAHSRRQDTADVAKSEVMLCDAVAGKLSCPAWSS